MKQPEEQLSDDIWEAALAENKRRREESVFFEVALGENRLPEGFLAWLIDIEGSNPELFDEVNYFLSENDLPSAIEIFVLENSKWPKNILPAWLIHNL